MNFEPIKQYFKKPKFIELEDTKYKIKVKGKTKTKNKKKTDFNNLSPYEITKYMYKNTRGINTPDSFMLVLDSRAIGSSERENDFVYNKVVFDLCDPIIIDSPTDIYLEFLHFQNTDISQADGTEITSHLELTSQFYIDIDELSIKNISNNQFQSGKFLIPNDVYGKTDKNQNDNDTNVRTSYIRLKSNYLCRIEANYLTKLTLSIRGEGANGAAGSDDTTFGYLSNSESTGAAFTSITTEAELIAWATDSNATGQLQNDFTLSAGSWPLDLNDNKILDGNGYTITLDPSITSGLFALNTNEETATVKYVIIHVVPMTVDQDQGVLFGTGNDSDDLTINVNDVGFTGTFTLGLGCGSVFGKFDANTGCNVTIKNCFTTATIGQGAGGFIGAHSCKGGGSIKIHNCFSTGSISAAASGGIVGNQFGLENDTEGNAVITNCYSTGAIQHVKGGGIVGRSAGNNATEDVLIGNCYSFGNINSNGGGIVGENAFGGNVVVENCHAKHATGNGVGANQIITSENGSGGSSTITNSTGGSGAWTPNLGTILKDSYTDSFGELTDTDVWVTSGLFSNGYGLTVFSNSPWNGYTSNTTLPTLTNGFNAAASSDGTGAVKLGLYFKKTKEKSKDTV